MSEFIKILNNALFFLRFLQVIYICSEITIYNYYNIRFRHQNPVFVCSFLTD